MCKIKREWDLLVTRIAILVQFVKRIAEEQIHIKRNLETIMTALQDAIQGWSSYAQELKAQRDAAVALAETASAKAQENADALAAFQADDAATDASQLAEKEAADAKEVQDALDALKAQDEPTQPETPGEETPAEPVVEPAPTTGDPADTHAAPPAE